MTGALILEARRRAAIAQKELARRAGTSQSAVARLEAGGASPTVATLERLVAAAGFELRFVLTPRVQPDPMVEAYKRDVDRTLLRENLRRSIDERIRSLGQFQEFTRKLRKSMRTRVRSENR